MSLAISSVQCHWTASVTASNDEVGNLGERIVFFYTFENPFGIVNDVDDEKLLLRGRPM